MNSQPGAASTRLVRTLLTIDYNVHNALSECIGIRVFGVSQYGNTHLLFRYQKNGCAGLLAGRQSAQSPSCLGR